MPQHSISQPQESLHTVQIPAARNAMHEMKAARNAMHEMTATQCMKYKRGGQGAGAVAAAPDAQLAQLQFAEVLGHVAGRSQRRCKRSRQILHCGLAAAIGRNIAISR